MWFTMMTLLQVGICWQGPWHANIHVVNMNPYNLT